MNLGGIMFKIIKINFFQSNILVSTDNNGFQITHSGKKNYKFPTQNVPQITDIWQLPLKP